MSFATKDDLLLFNGSAIYEAPGPVKIEHIFNDKALILYDPNKLYDSSILKTHISLESEALWEVVSRNILMIDSDGEILWRIENTNYKNMPDRYLWASFSDKEGWSAYTLGGYLKTFNIHTGKILKSKYSP